NFTSRLYKSTTLRFIATCHPLSAISHQPSAISHLPSVGVKISFRFTGVYGLWSGKRGAGLARRGIKFYLCTTPRGRDSTERQKKSAGKCIPQSDTPERSGSRKIF